MTHMYLSTHLMVLTWESSNKFLFPMLTCQHCSYSCLCQERRRHPVYMMTFSKKILLCGWNWFLFIPKTPTIEFLLHKCRWFRCDHFCNTGRQPRVPRGFHSPQKRCTFLTMPPGLGQVLFSHRAWKDTGKHFVGDCKLHSPTATLLLLLLLRSVGHSAFVTTLRKTSWYCCL